VTSNTFDIEDVAKQRMSMRLHNVRYSGMSASWEVENATQITRSGAATTGTLPTQVAAQNGGSGRGYQVLFRAVGPHGSSGYDRAAAPEDRISIHRALGGNVGFCKERGSS
jgi:hypothetical protein